MSRLLKEYIGLLLVNENKGVEWLKSSLSKAFYKTNNDIIPILEELNLIEMVKQ